MLNVTASHENNSTVAGTGGTLWSESELLHQFDATAVAIPTRDSPTSVEAAMQGPAEFHAASVLDGHCVLAKDASKVPKSQGSITNPAHDDDANAGHLGTSAAHNGSQCTQDVSKKGPSGEAASCCWTEPAACSEQETPPSCSRSACPSEVGDSGGTGTAALRALSRGAGSGSTSGRGSVAGKIFRVAYSFNGMEDDSSQLSLMAGDFVRVQCRDASGWTYGRLECPSQCRGGARSVCVGVAGWFPEAVLSDHSAEAEYEVEAKAVALSGLSTTRNSMEAKQQVSSRSSHSESMSYTLDATHAICVQACAPSSSRNPELDPAQQGQGLSRVERVGAKPFSSERDLHDCERRLYECAISQQRYRGACETAARGAEESEAAAENAERLLASLEEKERKFKAEAPCVAGCGSPSLKHNWEARVRLLEVKKAVASGTLQSARKQLEAEKNAMGLARERLRFEQQVGSAAVEAVSRHRGHAKVAQGLSQPVATSPLTASRVPLVARSPPLTSQSRASRLRQRVNGVESCSPSRSSGNCSGRAGAISPPRRPATPGPVCGPRPVAQSSAAQHTAPDSVHAPVSATLCSSPSLTCRNSPNRGIQSPNRRSNSPQTARRNPPRTVAPQASRVRLQSCINGNVTNLHTQVSGAPQARPKSRPKTRPSRSESPIITRSEEPLMDVTNEELTRMFDVLRSAEDLRAKLASMPHHLRHPVAQRLSELRGLLAQVPDEFGASAGGL